MSPDELAIPQLIARIAELEGAIDELLSKIDRPAMFFDRNAIEAAARLILVREGITVRSDNGKE